MVFIGQEKPSQENNIENIDIPYKSLVFVCFLNIAGIFPRDAVKGMFFYPSDDRASTAKDGHVAELDSKAAGFGPHVPHLRRQHQFRVEGRHHQAGIWMADGCSNVGLLAF